MFEATPRPFALLVSEPCFDDDAMAAGADLERALLDGFKDSCAAVFFVTPNFTDDGYLATEVNYAIAEKRKKGERFAIITLVFGDDTATGSVPELLRTYVYKHPADALAGVREILRALPIAVGPVHFVR